MSFQDFGRGKGGRPTATPSRAAVPKSSDTTGSASSPSSSALEAISESLNQYQRNVAILEKIVHQLGVSPKRSPEVEEQYKAQVDVVRQLESKVQGLLDTKSNNPTMLKLSKDFYRVQSQAKQLKEIAKSRKKLQVQQSQGHVADEAAAKQFQQLQMQEDKLHEEIMREREEEIRNINKGMHQVNEIYKDLAHIVGSQQEQIDQIETQMEDSRANAEAGLAQVEKANEKYNQSQCTIS